ncbi:MAG: ABC transporter permease subunit [Chloroflexota bacterium]|nr:ABC transporter permease subunit [Chloroflexota bacterium]
MIADICTMIWKECREVLRLSGSKRSTALKFLILMVIYGVIFPWQAGIAWVTTPISLVFWAMVPVLLVVTMVADSFAGERERHTLETLLATRLSDRAILFGKIGAIVCHTWVVTQIVMIIVLVPINIRFWEGRISFYSADVMLSGLGLSLLVASLVSTVGVLISLRANSVKQAQQTLGLAVFTLAWGPILALLVLPDEWKTHLGQILKVFLASGADLTQVILIVAAALVVLTAVFLAIAMSRFQRASLILD